MYIGIPNPNILMPLEKMKIKNLDKSKSIEVLYNPQSYVRSRSVTYAQIPLMGGDAPIVQFQHGTGEVLSFDLFFDSISAGSEVGGGLTDRLKFTANSLPHRRAGLHQKDLQADEDRGERPPPTPAAGGVVLPPVHRLSGRLHPTVFEI